MAQKRTLPSCISLADASIDYSSLFNNDGKLNATVGSILGLSALKPLHSRENERFIPSKLYIRQEMIDVFDKLTTDRKENPDIIGQVLIGARGVGKSVLFFLVAIWQAVHENRVIYWRKTKTSALDESVSVFSFSKSNAKETTIEVRFSRSVEEDQTLYALHNDDLCGQLEYPRFNQLEKKMLVFVDGPNHKDKMDTFSGKANYFCTSGGHPLPKPEARRSQKLVTLCGWREPTLKDALNAILERPLTDDEFASVYYLTGGRIRDALRVALDNNERESLKDEYQQSVTMDSVKASELATQSTEGSAEEKSKDTSSWRTMFVSKNRIVYQVVDSVYLLVLLTAKCNLNEILKAYNLTMTLGARAAAGWLFEELMHKWFCDKHPSPCVSHHRGTGTAKESVLQLVDSFVYWMPSIHNFGNIDAAMADGHNCIHCVQYTIQSTHALNQWKLHVDVIGGIQNADNLKDVDTVQIYYTVPLGNEFQVPLVQEELGGVKYFAHVVFIDVASAITIDTSSRNGFIFLNNHA